MNKKTMSLLGILLIILIILGCAFYYTRIYYKRIEIADFTLDYLSTMKSIVDTRSRITGKERWMLAQEDLLNVERLKSAKSKISKWLKSKNKQIVMVVKKVNNGIDKIIETHILFARILSGESDNADADLAKAGAKLKSGRSGFIDASVDLISIISNIRRRKDVGEVKINLTHKQRKIILEYIYSNFKKYVDKYDENVERKITGYELPEEVWGVIFVRNLLEKGVIMQKPGKSRVD